MPRNSRTYQLQRSLIYHILNRGILRQAIFHDQEDVDTFLSLLRRYKEQYQFQIYHWVIIGNHYHLVLELSKPRELSKLIAALQQIYARQYHHRHNTAGRLFQNRFKSQAIDRSSYLLACGRYVERNPVRAGLVKLPWQWQWSSAAYYALGKEDNITDTDPEWRDGRPEDYQKWLLDDKAKEEELSFHSNAEAIGNNLFLKKLTNTEGRLSLQGRGRPRGNNLFITALK